MSEYEVHVRGPIKCPICKEKFLVGGHKKKCMELHPLEWFKFMAHVAEASAGRRGRNEMLSSK